MKKLTIFTDPHLGTSRAAHTTRTSSDALKEALYFQALSIVETAENPVICVGDLFDKAFNPESVLVQGFNVASKCLMTLSGNHDMTNREGTVTSLDALAEMGVPICRTPDLTNPYFDAFESIYMVPHHASQIVFEQAMRDAAAHAASTRDGLASYLFLHCNYDFDLAKDDNTLNLTKEMAEEIGESFDFIFIGHEHNGSRHLNGKVVVLGNTHPTSFHDVGDKFIYHLDLESAELTEEKIWSKTERFREIKLGSEIPDLAGVHFVDVVGSEAVANAGEVQAYIQEIWKAAQYRGGPDTESMTAQCDLFAVRNKVDIKDSLADTDVDVEAPTLGTLKDRIAKDLEGSDLAALFNELVLEVTA